MRKIAIIPARGGSKRLPLKNIRDFLGKPIIAYSIMTALESRLFDEVMVSTDHEETAEIALKYGATVPFMRSAVSSNDHATLNDVLEEVFREYSSRGTQFSFGCCILPTAPLIRSENLRAAFDLLRSGKFDSVRPIVRYEYPVQRAFRYKEGGGVEMFDPSIYRVRSQDLEEAYHDAGQFYFFKTSTLLASANRGALILPPEEVQDIDNETDWKLAAIKYQLMHGQI